MKKPIIDENKVLDAVRKNPGSNNEEIARITGYETEDSNGRNKNWAVSRVLKELEERGLIEDRRPIKRRGYPCQWHIAK